MYSVNLHFLLRAEDYSMQQSLKVKRSLYNFVYGQESVESSQDCEEHMVSSLLLGQVRDCIDIPGTIH